MERSIYENTAGPLPEYLSEVNCFVVYGCVIGIVVFFAALSWMRKTKRKNCVANKSSLVVEGVPSSSPSEMLQEEHVWFAYPDLFVQDVVYGFVIQTGGLDIKMQCMSAGNSMRGESNLKHEG